MREFGSLSAARVFRSIELAIIEAARVPWPEQASGQAAEATPTSASVRTIFIAVQADVDGPGALKIRAGAVGHAVGWSKSKLRLLPGFGCTTGCALRAGYA